MYVATLLGSLLDTAGWLHELPFLLWVRVCDVHLLPVQRFHSSVHCNKKFQREVIRTQDGLVRRTNTTCAYETSPSLMSSFLWKAGTNIFIFKIQGFFFSIQLRKCEILQVINHFFSLLSTFICFYWKYFCWEGERDSVWVCESERE